MLIRASWTHWTANVAGPCRYWPLLKWFLKATAQYTRGTVLYVWDEIRRSVRGLWKVNGRHVLPLSASAFSGYDADFQEKARSDRLQHSRSPVLYAGAWSYQREIKSEAWKRKERKERDRQRSSCDHTNLIISLLARLSRGHADLYTVLQPNVSSLLDPPLWRGSCRSTLSPLSMSLRTWQLQSCARTW